MMFYIVLMDNGVAFLLLQPWILNTITYIEYILKYIFALFKGYVQLE